MMNSFSAAAASPSPDRDTEHVVEGAVFEHWNGDVVDLFQVAVLFATKLMPSAAVAALSLASHRRTGRRSSASNCHSISWASGIIPAAAEAAASP